MNDQKLVFTGNMLKSKRKEASIIRNSAFVIRN